MFGNDYTHLEVNFEQAEALTEIAIIDALRVGMIAAQIRASENGAAPDWLDRFDTFLSNRHRSLRAAIEDAGIMYHVRNDGQVRPVYVAARRVAG